MENAPLRHEAPARAFQADDEVLLGRELVPVRRLPDGDVELCAVPFSLPRLALGDAVRTTSDGYNVVARSGHGVAHVWLGDSFLPRTELADELVGLGAVVERNGENDLAVDIAPSVSAGVLARLRELGESNQVRFRLGQPAVAPLVEPERAAIAARVRAVFDAHREHLGDEVSSQIEGSLAVDQVVLALEVLISSLGGDDVVLTAAQHADLVDLLGVVGLSTLLLPPYGITLSATSPTAPGTALATVLAAATTWETAEAQWPDGSRAELAIDATSSDAQAFRFGALPGNRLLVVGPSVAERVGPYVVISGFSYAELFTEVAPYRVAGRVITSGQLVLGPAGAPDFHSPEAENAAASLTPEVLRLRDLLAAPGSMRRLATRRIWPELFGFIMVGFALSVAGIGLSTQSPSTLPLLLLPVGLGLMVVPILVNRFRLASAGRRFGAEGWIATSVRYERLGSPLSNVLGLDLHVLLPEEMPLAQRPAVVDRITELLRDPATLSRVLRLLQVHVTRGFSARDLDPALPSKVLLHGIPARLPSPRAYAVVPRRSGSRADVLAIRPGALSATGLGG